MNLTSSLPLTLVRKSISMKEDKTPASVPVTATASAALRAVADALAPRLLVSLGYGATAQSATSTWRQDASSR